MRRGINQEFARIVNAVLAGLSLEGAAMKLDYQISREGIRSLKTGKVGWERTVRTFAFGFAARLTELYGAEIEVELGDCCPGSVAEWLARKAGFRVAVSPMALPPLDADSRNGLIRIANETMARYEARAEPLTHLDRRHPEIVAACVWIRKMELATTGDEEQR